MTKRQKLAWLKMDHARLEALDHQQLV
jgi:hypothetical protein